MSDLQTGDVVQLKSGGPKMTVIKFEGEYVDCYWFASPNEIKRHKFEYVTLDKVEEAKN